MSPVSKFDLIAFDVDGTLVDDTVFVWKTLHDYFGSDTMAVDKAFEMYMGGRLSYRQWFEHDIKLFREKGATRTVILDAIKNMKLFMGAQETLETLGKTGARLIIISGSLNLVVEKFGLDDYFHEIYLNHLEFAEDGELIGGVATPYDVWDKATGLRDVASRHNIPMSSTAFIGDNFNDIAVAKAAGFSIAFNCKSDELAESANVVVEEKDLRAILPHLLAD